MLIKVIGDEIYFDNEKIAEFKHSATNFDNIVLFKEICDQEPLEKIDPSKKIKRLIEEIQDSVQDAYRAVSNAEDEINWLERKIDELEEEL